MHGRIFLGSPFSQLLKMREEIWRIIEKRPLLKCVSLQHEHVESRPSQVIPNIQLQIDDSSHFIFIVGPKYGTKLSDPRHGLFLPPEYEWAKEKSFTEFELTLALGRLRKLRDEERVSSSHSPKWFSAHLLLLRLWPPTTTSADERQINTMLQPVFVLGVEVSAIGVRRDLTPHGDQHSQFLGRVNSFLKVVEDDERGLVNSFLAEHPIERRKHIQIAGWSGLEDYDHYTEFMNEHQVRDDHLSFLTMDRSVISLPAKPKYYPRRYYTQPGTSLRSLDFERSLDFDFVIADVELVQHYIKTGSIGSFSRELNPRLRHKLEPNPSNSDRDIIPLVRDLTWPVIRDGDGSVQGIPLLYGFNEFLVQDRAQARGLRMTTENSSSPDWGYCDFDLKRLLCETNVRIGIWGWWLASFPIILFSHWSFAANRSEILKSIETPFKDHEFIRQFEREGWASVSSFSGWLEFGARDNLSRECLARLLRATIALLLAELKDKVPERDRAGRLMLFGSLIEKRDARHSLDVLIGSSSAVLPTWPPPTNELAFRPIVPREGVFAWINCVCPYNKQYFDDIHAKLLEYLLEPRVQESFSIPVDASQETYIGIPVIREALDKFMTVKLYGPIIETIRTVQPSLVNKAETATTSRVVALRPFSSQTWPLFEYSWQELIDGLRDLKFLPKADKGLRSFP